MCWNYLLHPRKMEEDDGSIYRCCRRFDSEESNAITQLFQDSPYGFWHWIENFWIVQGDNKHETAEQLWDEISRRVPAFEPKTTLVMRIDNPVSYWGRADKKAWDWLRTEIGDNP